MATVDSVYAKLLLHCNSNFTDSSLLQNTVTPYGNAAISAVSPLMGAGSCVLDGAGDYLQVSDAAGIEPGSYDWTFAIRVYLTAYPSSFSGVYAASLASKDEIGSRSFALLLRGSASSWDGLYLNLFNDTQSLTQISISHSFTLNTEYHIAVERSGTTVTVYVDGVSVGSGTFSGALYNSSAPFRIGATAYTGYEYYLPAKIDEVLWYVGAPLYGGAFTPPVDEYTLTTLLSIAETMSAVDAPIRFFAGAISEAANAMDSNIYAYGMTVTEVSDAADTNSTLFNGTRVLTESPDIAGTALPNITALNSVIESAVTSDQLTRFFAQAQADGLTVQEAITLIFSSAVGESVSVSSTVRWGFWGMVTEWFRIQSSADYTWTIRVLESVVSRGTVTHLLRALNGISETLNVAELFRFIFPKTVTESLAASTTVASTHRKLAVIAERLRLTGIAVSSHQAAQIVAEAVVAHAEAGHAWAMRVVEALGASGSVAAAISKLMQVIEAVAIDDTPAYTFNLQMVISEAINLEESAPTNAVLLNVLSEGITFAGLIRLGDVVYDAWCLNTETFAAWKYENYNFNSFAAVDGTYFGMTDEGLYALEGDDDNGEPIAASIKTGLVDLGTRALKNVPRAYLGYTASGQLLLWAHFSHRGRQVSQYYTLHARDSEMVDKAGVRLSREALSSYWQFELRNVDGSDFELDDLEVIWEPVNLRRRVR